MTAPPSARGDGRRAFGPIRGRGTADTPSGRFEPIAFSRDPDAWVDEDDLEPNPRTRYLNDTSRSALATNQSPDVDFDASLNPYRGCEHGCIYCLGADTPVLHADLHWGPIGDVRVGDVLVGFDEFPAPGGARRLRRSGVLAVWWSRKPTLRMVTGESEVITTREHHWLAGPEQAWRPAGRIERGSLLHRLSHLAPGDTTPGHEKATSPAPAEAIEAGPRRDVVDIQTTTGTFWAAGLATHNCFARPTHEYLGLSAGLDFETKILVKRDAPELLRRELASPKWQPQVIAMSGVTDAYQPVEARLLLTRRCLEVMAEFRNPVSIVTKSRLVARDADVLARLARHGAATVSLSVTSLDPALARVMEPRAAQPGARLAAIGALAKAGVPVGAMIGPVVPGLTDHEIPAIVAAVAAAGAQWASTIVMRLPHGVKELFSSWLETHFPDRRSRVLSRVRSLRDGRLNDPRFGSRLSGRGAFADQIHDLFRLACRRNGLPTQAPELLTACFRRPGGEQLTLF